MTTFMLELRQAWRSLLQRKAYFLTCAATLTLVLGANAAMFAVVNATMLRPMPFKSRGEVLHLYSQPPGTTTVLQRNPLQQMELPRLRERVRTLARLEGFLQSERVVTLNGEPGVAQTAAVTPGLLSMMAAPIERGRTFLDGEAQPGQFVALITDRYWRDTLGARSVIDTPLVIDGQPHSIVGILSPSFAVPFIDAQIFTPLYANPEPQRRAPPLSVVTFAELAPGASLAQARDELVTISRQMSQEFPASHSGWTHGAETAREWQYGSMRAAVLMLFAATAFVLAMIAGVASGVVLHRLKPVRETLDPLFATYYAIPIFAFYPLLIILFGLGDAPQILIGFMLAVVAVIVNTLNGLDRVPRTLMKTAYIARMGPVETVLRISLPYAAPYILTGAKLAVAYSLIGIIGAEFIMSRGGMGYEISFAYNNFDNATMYPLILLILLVSITINMLLARWEKRLMTRRGQR